MAFVPKDLIEQIQKLNLSYGLAFSVADWVWNEYLPQVAETNKKLRVQSPEDRKEALLDAIHKTALKGNAFSQRLEAQIHGLIVEKQEVTHRNEFTAEQLIQIGQRVVTGLRSDFAKGDRNCQVCGRPPLLSDHLRLDTGRHTAESGQVGGLALPGEPAQGLSEPQGDSGNESSPAGDNVAGSKLLPVEEPISE